MKKMIFALIMMLTASVSASAMSYEQARNEALFLTDKMAYELNLTDAQYEAAYEINLDYLMGVTGQGDVFGTYWERRNLDLSYILYSWQWEAFRAATYFYRPLYWDAGYWHFGIYARYPHRDYFYFGRPHFYATYRGGHSWHMNGGRSFYHGRDSHFRPALPPSRQHFGMRNGYDRGDYRGARNGSSTRVTGHHDSRMNGNGHHSSSYDNNRSGRFGSNSGRPSGNVNRESNMGNRPSGSSTENRPSGSNMGNRPSGSNMGNRPSGSSMGSRPSGSSMGSRPSGSSMGSRPSGSSSRGTHSSGGSSAGSRSSGSSSNSHGHFGGRR